MEIIYTNYKGLSTLSLAGNCISISDKIITTDQILVVKDEPLVLNLDGNSS
jgi:hypothetical protein